MLRKYLPVITILLVGCCASWKVANSAEFVIQPYLQNPGKKEMTIRWTSDVGVEFLVRYGTGDQLSQRMVVKPFDKVEEKTESKGEVAEEHLYEAILVGLSPDTSYKYEVSVKENKLGGSFQTVPETSTEFKFIVYGDSRTQADEHRQVVTSFIQHRPAFVIHTGDMVTNGGYSQWKPQFFDPLKGVANQLPLWLALGNHEGNQVSYRQLFSLPGNERWYSFDYGNAHFVCLDSNGGSERMLEWCRQDLAASKATWKIVFYHHPSYDTGWHRSAWGRKDFLPVFRKHGVDLVFTGHSHTYQRFKPMYEKGQNEKHPITYVVTAGGGAPLYSAALDPHLAANAHEHHYAVVSIKDEKLSVCALTPKGKTLDEFSISKSNGQLDPAYIKAALPEADFSRLRDMVAPFLKDLTFVGDLRSGQPVSVKFSLGADQKDLKFNVHLERRAVPYYEMESVVGEARAGGTTEVELQIKLKEPGSVERGHLLPLLRLECDFEIEGQKGSVFAALRRQRTRGAK